jgi:hypothetical protein
MEFFKRLFKHKVEDTSEKRRLAVAMNERALREGFNHEHYENVLRAREFGLPPQIRRLTNSEKSVK